MEQTHVYRVSDCPHNLEKCPHLIGQLYENHPMGVVCILHELRQGDLVIRDDIKYEYRDGNYSLVEQ